MGPMHGPWMLRRCPCGQLLEGSRQKWCLGCVGRQPVPEWPEWMRPTGWTLGPIRPWTREASHGLSEGRDRGPVTVRASVGPVADQIRSVGRWLAHPTGALERWRESDVVDVFRGHRRDGSAVWDRVRIPTRSMGVPGSSPGRLAGLRPADAVLAFDARSCDPVADMAERRALRRFRADARVDRRVTSAVTRSEVRTTAEEQAIMDVLIRLRAQEADARLRRLQKRAETRQRAAGIGRREQAREARYAAMRAAMDTVQQSATADVERLARHA